MSTVYLLCFLGKMASKAALPRRHGQPLCGAECTGCVHKLHTTATFSCKNETTNFIYLVGRTNRCYSCGVPAPELEWNSGRGSCWTLDLSWALILLNIYSLTWLNIHENNGPVFFFFSHAQSNSFKKTSPSVWCDTRMKQSHWLGLNFFGFHFLLDLILTWHRPH